MSKLLDKTDELQKKTIDSLDRIKTNMADMETIGSMSLEELKANSEQINNIIDESRMIDCKLDTTKKLQKKFNLWNGNISGYLFGNKANKVNKVNKVNNIKIPDTFSDNKTTNNVKISNSNNKMNIMYKITDVKIINFPNQYTNKTDDKTDNEIDEETKKRLNKINKFNNKIDNAINDISCSLDKILDMSNSMSEEVNLQNKKLDKLNNEISNINQKQYHINKELKKQLNRN